MAIDIILNESPLLKQNDEKKKEFINLQNENGETVLHQACLKGFLSLIKKYIEYGANMTIRNKNGKMPLQILKYDDGQKN